MILRNEKNSLLNIFCVLAILGLEIQNVQSQTLPRRVYLGIRMENLTDDARNLMDWEM
jgi:hypothetical protein